MLGQTARRCGFGECLPREVENLEPRRFSLAGDDSDLRTVRRDGGIADRLEVSVRLPALLRDRIDSQRKPDSNVRLRHLRFGRESPRDEVAPRCQAWKGKVAAVILHVQRRVYPGIFDLATGTSERIPLDYAQDFHHMAWTPDGKVMAVAVGFRGSIWKFTPEGK